MAVNLEVKGSLAKCLATENLIIEHKKVPTASFDVDRRVLTLPNWDRASATVYDLLVGHEVGHALFTDNVDWTVEYPDVPKDFVNVLEDVRVERLMKKKFAGLSRTFYNGYNELNDEDFFSTRDEDLDKCSFIDRINLYFKIGAFHNIAFSDEENEFLTRASQTESFDDVLRLSKDVTDFVKATKQEPMQSPLPQQGQGEEGEDEEQDSPETSPEGSQAPQEDGQQEPVKNGSIPEEKQSSPGGGGSQQQDNELESKTQDSFDEQLESLTNKYRSEDTYYVELPTFDLDKLIITNEYIHNYCDNWYESAEENRSWVGEGTKIAMRQYATFKKSAQKEVNYMVKEFECRKSADQYARSSTARTGVLDTAKLHTYKYNEDLFKKVSVVPDGKNHGLIFIIDWSGSMCNFILDAYKQLCSLMWFCKKVNIPFEVYAFTLEPSAYIETQPNHPDTYNRKEGLLVPESSFRLLNLFTSKVNNPTLEKQMGTVWKTVYSHQYRQYESPNILDLSGTPLGETIMALHQVIPAFQSANKLQKVNCVFLTDGEGYQNAITVKKKRFYDDEEIIGTTRKPHVAIRNRKLGRVYPEFDWNHFPMYSKILLNTVRDAFPSVNLINFRITPAREFSNCWHWYGNGSSDLYEKLKMVYRKQQCVQFDDTGYDQFNVLAASALNQDDEFIVKENATKAQIKKSFTKMLGSKKTNKKILGSFIELIA
tara:strand:+ start:4860 stop:6992 length:2133 start_codon:yes stop_codon:yes gene_type:complete